ncbi:MAG: hypothetical protein QW579_00070 [Desulfurococcaceae archaeon]
MMKITLKCKNNYWRFTVHSWLLEIKDVLESELGEEVIIEIIDADNEDSELYVDGYFIGAGVPGEEGYLIEIIKKSVLRIRDLE